LREMTQIKPVPIKRITQSINQERSLFFKGLITILILVTGAYVHYSTPQIVSSLLQLLVLFFYFRSNKNYLWIFVFLFVNFSPGGLYGRSMPLYLASVPGLGILRFEMAFILVSLLKALKNPVPVFYRNNYLIIVIYIVILVIIEGIAHFTTFFRGMINFSWLLILPCLLRNKDEFASLFYLIFLGNILAFVFNIYQISTGTEFVSSFAGIDVTRRIYEPDLQYVRTIGGGQFAFLSIIGGLLYLNSQESELKPFISYISIVIGMLNILSSGTRGWIFASVFLIVIYSFFMIPRLLRNILLIVPLIILTIVVVWNIPLIRNQLLNAYNRSLYHEYLLDLDPETSEVGRIRRGARVMEKFREKPIIGFGFGDETREYADGHAGNQYMLLTFGIVGFLLFLRLWLGFISKLLASDNLLKPRKREHRINILISLSLVSAYLIHSTSGAFMYPTSSGVYWYGMIFAYGNYLYYKQKKNSYGQYGKI